MGTPAGIAPVNTCGVYLLEGELTDLTLERTFGSGDYACRPPGMPHGPYRTTGGCTVLEIRYSAR